MSRFFTGISVAAVGTTLLIAFLAACSPRLTPAADIITVEGTVMARGHEPFVRYVLETEEGNLYALRINEDVQEGFETPARIRATGRLYVADWDGRPFAHLDVSAWSRLP